MKKQQPLYPLVEKPGHIPQNLVVDFDIYNPPNLENGFHEAWKTLHDEGMPEILWTPYNGGHWIVSRTSEMTEVLNQFETFSSRVIIVPKEVGENYHILPTHLSPPEHRPYRLLLNTGLSPKRIQSLKGEIESLINKLVEGVRAKGECCFTTEIAEPFPTAIIMLILGLPVEDGPYLKKFADQIMRPDGSMTLPEAEGKIIEYLRPFIEARRDNPVDDMISGLVNGKINGESLPDDEAFQLCVEVVIAGLDTVVNFLNFIMLFLAEYPEQRRRLVDDPSLIPAAADEFVRRYGLVVVGRYVEHDIKFHGIDIKEGEMIICPTFISGIDEQINPDPMRVEFDRDNVSHTTFGAGPHRCAGAPLARVELIAAMQAWLSRIPDFEVKVGTKPTFKAGTVGSMENLYLTWDVGSTTAIPA
ncbi:MAG: cytochrome P450 [Spongiibacteraceae bacterium]